IGAALDRLEPAAQQPTQARLAEALYIWPLSAALLISLLMVAANLWSAQLQRLAWRREQRHDGQPPGAKQVGQQLAHRRCSRRH
ncbi:BatB protein, partial [Stutzerimonas stutzeri]|nr:BatB protein [Stutzerimonas stutzeri]